MLTPKYFCGARAELLAVAPATGEPAGRPRAGLMRPASAAPGSPAQRSPPLPMKPSRSASASHPPQCVKWTGAVISAVADAASEAAGRRGSRRSAHGWPRPPPPAPCQHQRILLPYRPGSCTPCCGKVSALLLSEHNPLLSRTGVAAETPASSSTPCLTSRRPSTSSLWSACLPTCQLTWRQRAAQRSVAQQPPAGRPCAAGWSWWLAGAATADPGHSRYMFLLITLTGDAATLTSFVPRGKAPGVELPRGPV